MTYDQIDEKNWTYTSYKCGNLEAFISVGAAPEGEDIKLEYFLNKSKNSEIIFQENFTSLKDAVNRLNETYNHWKFQDKEAELAASGCSTCQAH